MNRLLTFVKHEPRKYLGRWTVDYCDQVLNSKIRLANEDHCGTCGTIYLKTTERENKTHRMNKETISRYNEYINAAIRERKAVKEVSSIEKQIEYYICLN